MKLILSSNLPKYEDISGIGGFILKDYSLGGIVSHLLPYAYALAGLILLVYTLIGGFKLLTSAGDPKKVAGGQKILTNAVVGFLIVIASYWIAQII